MKKTDETKTKTPRSSSKSSARKDVVHRTTAPRRAKEALQEERNTAQQYLDIAGVLIAALNSDGQITLINQKGCEILGYEENELIGRKWVDICLPGEVRGEVQGVLERLMAGELEPVKYHENAVLTKGGAQRILAFHNALIQNEVSQIIGILFSGEDITERKRAEDALHKNEQRLASIYDTVGDVIFYLAVEPNEQYRFTSVNPAFCRVTGLPSEQVIDRKVNEIIPEPSLNMVLGKYRQAIEEKTIVRWEEASDYPTGRLTGEVSIAPVFDDAGNCTHLVGSVHDITERKHADEALRQSESALKKAQRVAHVGSWVWHIQSNRLEWSDEMYSIFGIEKEKFSGDLTEVVARAIHPEDWAKVEQSNLTVIKDKQPIPLEHRVIWPDGTVRVVWAEAGELILDETGKPDILTGIVQDITERKQAEEVLRLRMEQLVALHQTSQAVATSLDLDQVLTEVMSLAGRVAGSEYTSVVLVDEAGRISRGVENVPGVLSIERRARKRGFTSWILRARRPALVDEIGEGGIIRPRVGEDAPRTANPYLVAKGIKSFVGLPLIVEERTVGVLYLHSLRPGTFHDQLTLLTTFASQAAIAIEKARLYDTVQKELTERKQTEQALRESEERFREIFENMSSGVVVYEAVNGGEDFKINNFNRAAEKIEKITRETVIGKTVCEAFPGVREFGLFEVLQHVWETGKPEHFPVGFYKDERMSGWRENYMARLPSGEVVTVYDDVTERKRVEEALARQAEELRQRNEELARLYRASGSLLSGASLSLQELAQTIVGVVQQEFGQANCSLLVIHRDSNELQRLAAAGPYAEQVKNKTLTLGGPGLVPQAIRTGVTLNVGNVRSTPDYLPNWEAAQSELTVPLKIGSDVIGAIDVQSAQPNAFSPDDERLMTIFAERAALALEHSRLYAQTETRVQQLAALRTIDMAISSSFDINLTLGILLDQLSGQLGVHAADILAYNPISQTFRFSCGQGFRTQALQHTRLRLGEGFAGRAALERRVLKVPDLRAEPAGFSKSPLIFGEDFVTYVGVPLIAKGQIKGVLEIFQREPLDLNSEEQAFLEILAGQAAIAIDNAELFDHLQSSIADLNVAYDSTLEGWASALELRDKATEGHTRRVTGLTMQLAQALGVKENDLMNIYRGALLHDIGKMGAPDSIVLKPGPLTEEEWVIMRKHPQYAYDMLSLISYLHLALDIPYCHHERWDGTGYPRGLKGEQIPLAARIFAVVDVWDALTSDRPYRKAWSKKKALEYIREQAGKHFDPAVVKAFLSEPFKKG